MPDTKPPPDKRPVGRPAEVGGQRVQVYLDAESLAIAAVMGNGNVSGGFNPRPPFPGGDAHLP